VCALASAAEVRSGVWRGRQVFYKLIAGTPVAQGDILLDNLDSDPGTGGSKGHRDAIGRNLSRYLWAGGVIPYVIDSELPEQGRITGAIEHWNNNTPIRLVRRTDEADYVRFRKHQDVCSSFVGRLSGEQAINIADHCVEGAVIHEIGHAVGLFHEQSRTDRDFYLWLIDKNADKRELGNFAQALTAGEDLGGYDYASIMHYSTTAFSKNGRPVLATVPAGIPIGQLERLSPADIDAVKRMYGAETNSTVITSFPFGLELEVDGQRVSTPHTVQWETGSVHTISAPEPPVSGSQRYVFGRWSDGGAQAHPVVASRDVTVYTASFSRQYRTPLGVLPAGAGRLQVIPSPAGDGWFYEGTEVEVRPVPNAGWNFAGWSGFGAFGLHGVSPDPLNFVILRPDLEYQANFVRSPVTMITSQPPGLKVVVDGETVTTPRGFVWTAGSTHKVDVTATTQLTGNDTARHLWQGWSDGGETSHVITAGTESQTYVARFRTQFIVTRSLISGGRVDLTPDGENGYYDAGSVLTLRPIADPAARFVSWSGDLTGSAVPGTLVVDEDKAFSASFGVPRQISSGGVVNGASFLPAGVSPGQIVTIFGTDIGSEDPVNARVTAGLMETALAGYRVMFDEIAAPLLYVTKNQIAAIAPYALTGRPDTIVRVIGPGWGSGGRLVPVVSAAPALFTANSSGKGAAAALNQDGSVNGAANPAPRGSVVMLYATGEGQTNPSVADGSITTSSPLRAPVQPVQARIASRVAKVHYAGSAPGLVAGVMQINVEIPSDGPTGAVPVSVRVGSASSPGNVSIFVGP
jgi:uncharacterized protein (TIGR03437 family)